MNIGLFQHNETLIRLIWALGIAGMGVGLFTLGNRLLLAHARSRVAGLHVERRDTPVLLYFTTPTCAPCKTIQRPAIQRVRELVGGRLEVVEIDAAAQPALASQWGVLSVPTTFIIDAHGQPRHVNHGVATAEKLLKQISEIF